MIGGCGLGLGYVSPVSTLIRWFPDRRGMATGMAIMGFGGGAIIGAPLKRYFIRHFYEQPDYLGTVDQVNLVTEAGRRFAEVGGQMREVVVVGANDVAGMIVRGAEGVYVVGTGDVGVAGTFVTLGLIYFVVMLAAAFSYRLPAPGWKPAGWTPPDAAHRAKRMISTHDVHIDEALKTRQFYQLWIVLCFNVTAGIGVLSVAQTMMTEIFGTTLPGIVDGGFAATYVVDDQRVQHARPLLLGELVGLHRPPQHVLDLLRARHRALSLDSVRRTQRERDAVRRLARVLLLRDDDHLHDVRRRLRDDPRLPRRHVRHALRRRHPRPAAHGLELGRVPGPGRDHVAARALDRLGAARPRRARRSRPLPRRRSERGSTSSTR